MGMFSDDDDNFLAPMSFRKYTRKKRSQRNLSNTSFDFGGFSHNKNDEVPDELFSDPSNASDYQKFDKDDWHKDFSRLRAFNPKSQLNQHQERGEASLFPSKTRHQDSEDWRKNENENQHQSAQMPPRNGFDSKQRSSSNSSHLRKSKSYLERRGKRMPQSEKRNLNQRNFETELSDNDEDPTQDVEKFKKSAQLANFSQIDQDGLIRSMHRRFLVKTALWESRAHMYSRLSFIMHFIVLVIQVFHILSQHFAEVFHIAPNTLQTMQYACAAVTALTAGLQMKLKLSEKCEKFRRGAKVYNRLKRATTYCLLLIDNGGKIEDVSMLWREAMSKESKSIPTASFFMAN